MAWPAASTGTTIGVIRCAGLPKALICAAFATGETLCQAQAKKDSGVIRLEAMRLPKHGEGFLILSLRRQMMPFAQAGEESETIRRQIFPADKRYRSSSPNHL